VDNFTAFACALAFVAVVAGLSRDRVAILGANILVGIWMLWSGFIMATGIYEPWHFGIVIDGLAAWLLLRAPSCRPRTVLAALYCVQIAMHIAYGIVVLTAAPDYRAYYDRLKIIGWLQLFLVGGWSIGSLWLRLLRARHISAASFHRADRAHMDRKR